MNTIGADHVVYVTPPNNKETERTRVLPGDVLLTITGSKIGRVCSVPKNFEEAYISQHVAIIRTKGINPVYLSFYLSMPACGQRIIAKQQYGQAKPGLNLTQIQNFQILDADLTIQNHFAHIVEKIESLKSRYQQSLTDLENLYGALSQQAFKGELNLSRVPLPLDNDEASPQAGQMNEQQIVPKTFQLPEPPENDEWRSAENRQALIEFWLNAWFQHYVGEPFSATAFIDAAYQRLIRLSERDAFRWDDPNKGWGEGKWSDEPEPFGTAEYEHIRQWVFDALATGKLKQSLDANQIQVVIPKRPPNWGTW